jgi:hypothetical protein
MQLPGIQLDLPEQRQHGQQELGGWLQRRSRRMWRGFTLGGFGRVLLMPCQGCFMCPFAIAGLGLRYLRINISEIFGHPFKKPLRVAFSSVETLGLPRN